MQGVIKNNRGKEWRKITELESIILEHTRAAVRISDLLKDRLFADTEEEANEISKQIDILKENIKVLRKRRLELIGK